VLVIGGEVYDERISSTRFTSDPAKGTTVRSAPSIQWKRYMTTGAFAQSTSEIIRNKLRAVLGVRFTDVRLRTYANRNTNAAGQLLGVPDKSLDSRTSRSIPV